MKPIKLIFTIALYISAASGAAEAASPMTTRFHNEASDTSVVTNLLIEGSAVGAGPEWFADKLIGKPYVAGTLEQSPEMLTVDMDEFDCTTLVETAMAMAMTVNERRSSWRDFIHNLEQLRYRGGEANGYGSRLHYISEWVVDNTHRGNFREVTDRIADATYVVKTLDFMSRNRDKYPMLADSANFEAIKSMEVGYRSHRFPMIKSLNVERVRLLDGDIIAITSSIKNLDVTHMGIVKLVDGKPHLIHASSKEGRVIVDPLTLADYLKRQRNATGIRVIRLQ